ncbi:Glycine cleavage system H protein [Clostridiaceae bacterium JG1575]|nr:Glycine cleavage system H protein [Clostridiaceae bacterium JG1575]
MDKMKDNLLYTKDHDWVRVEGDKAYVGLTDYAQHHLGSIVYVEAPEMDDEFAKGDTYGVVESVKAATDMYMPLSGKIVEVNDEVVDSPEKFNENPWDNWFVAVEIADKAELEELIKPEDYKKLLEEEE